MAPSYDIHPILFANSMRVNFVILKNNIFQNHLTQGIVALYRLGASEGKIKQFISETQNMGGGMYTAQEKGFDPTRESIISDSQATELLGKGASYYDLLAYYQQKLDEQYGGSVEKFIGGEIKKLGEGIMGELTHAIIEIGHGYSVGETGMVVEGMAWLHQGFAPPGLSRKKLAAPFTPGPMPLKEMLTKLQKDDRLKKIVLVADKNSIPGPSRVKCRLAALWGPESETLLDYVNQTNLEMTSDPNGVGDKLVDIALQIYVASKKRNEFFILHGLTGAWSTRQILYLLDDPESVRVCTRTFLMGILCLYVMQGSPTLDFNYIPPPNKEVGPEWSDIIARALKLEGADPHIYKVVQVCHDMAKKAPKEKQGFYKSGALVTLDHEISQFDDPECE